MCRLHASSPGRVGEIMMVAAAVGLFLLESWHPHAQLDDAFISYRYARNLVSGIGLVYNVGEYVEGFSNLLWTLLVAAGLALGGQAEVVGHALGLLTGAAVLVATWALARSYVPPRAADRRWASVVAPWIVLASVPFAVWATSGMETPLFTAAVAGAFLAERHDRPWSATTMAIVATLTRPEGALAAACIFGGRLLGRRTGSRAWAAALVVYGASVIALTGFRLWYYGDALPNTFYAKVGGIPVTRGLGYLGAFLVGGAIALVPGAIAAVRDTEDTRPAALYTLATAVYVVAIGGDAFRFARFLLPVLPLLAALAARGACVAVAARGSAAALVVSSYLAAPVWLALGPVAGVVTVAALLGFSVLAGTSGAVIAAVRPVGMALAIGLAVMTVVPEQLPGVRLLARGLRASRRATDSREFVQLNAYLDGLALRTATLLRAQQPPLRLVAVAGVGVIGYYSGLPIVDYLGLVDPVIAKSSTRPGETDLLIPGHQRSNADYVFARRPDFIVIGKGPLDGASYLPAFVAIWNHPDLRRYYEWEQRPLEGYRRRAGAP